MSPPEFVNACYVYKVEWMSIRRIGRGPVERDDVRVPHHGERPGQLARHERPAPAESAGEIVPGAGRQMADRRHLGYIRILSQQNLCNWCRKYVLSF